LHNPLCFRIPVGPSREQHKWASVWCGTAKERKRKRKRGHFNSTNFGTKSTLRAIAYSIQCFQPHAELVCISTGPHVIIAAHHIEAIPIAESFAPCNPQSPLIRAARTICIGIPRELYRWVKALLPPHESMCSSSPEQDCSRIALAFCGALITCQVDLTCNDLATSRGS
jgi:hypothetical protein